MLSRYHVPDLFSTLISIKFTSLCVKSISSPKRPYGQTVLRFCSHPQHPQHGLLVHVGYITGRCNIASLSLSRAVHFAPHSSTACTPQPPPALTNLADSVDKEYEQSHDKEKKNKTRYSIYACNGHKKERKNKSPVHNRANQSPTIVLLLYTTLVFLVFSPTIRIIKLEIAHLS